MRILADLAGDVPDLAAAEFRTLFATHDAPVTTLHEAPGFLDGHAEIAFDDAERLAPRLGLTRAIAMHLFDGVPGRWSEGAVDCCFPTGIPFAARYTKIGGDAPWSGPAVEREVGDILGAGRPVDLKNPRLIARAFILKDHVYVGQQLWEADPKAFRARHVENRPHSSPVSLEPRFARALVNLARVREGDVVVDPFCGTGGILIEAALLGARPYGGDLDPEMADGARKNLEHFGLAAHVVKADVQAFQERLAGLDVERVDAVVSDLPYGRSASMHREPMVDLYARAFEATNRLLKPGGFAVLGLPNEAAVTAAGRVLPLVEVHKVRAHKSLTRHFAVLRRT